MDERIGFGIYQSCRTVGVLNVCLCLGSGGVGGVGEEWVGGLNRVWKSGVVLCLCER